LLPKYGHKIKSKIDQQERIIKHMNKIKQKAADLGVNIESLERVGSAAISDSSFASL